MASNFQCIGLDPEDEAAFDRLVQQLIAGATPVGSAGDLRVLRWEDPSGARVVFGLRGNEIHDLLPSFAAEPGVRFAGLTRLNDDVLSGEVVDEDGDQLTAMAVEVEEHRLLDADPRPWSGLAAVTAFGTQVTVHADAEVFGESDDSLLNPESKNEPAPPHYVERGLKWPVRMAAESFVSMGVFGPPENADAYARMAGTVLRAERRRNTLSGLDFVVARVSTIGTEVTVCLSAEEHEVPAPGNVVSGMVFLVVSTGVTAPPPRRGLSRVLRHRG